MARFRNTGLVDFTTITAPEWGRHITKTGLIGATLNPFDRRISDGGSSGGSSAAVAAGIVPMAYGNDGPGSIGSPAAACNLFGLKPTRQRVSTGPFHGDLSGGRVPSSP